MARYNTWGIRFDDREYKIGEELCVSRHYEIEGVTEETLSGTSAIYVSSETDFLDYLDGTEEACWGELDKYNEALKANYPGRHIYLVAIESSWGYEWGEDENEIIMNGAEVVRVIR